MILNNDGGKARQWTATDNPTSRDPQHEKRQASNPAFVRPGLCWGRKNRAGHNFAEIELDLWALGRQLQIWRLRGTFTWAEIKCTALKIASDFLAEQGRV